MNAYLNLKSLLVEATAADAAQAALDQLPASVYAVTLDLDGTRGLVSDAQVEALVQVIRDRWPHPAFCLARCRDVQIWSRAAGRLSQPLLAWTAMREAGRVPRSRSRPSRDLRAAAASPLLPPRAGNP